MSDLISRSKLQFAIKRNQTIMRDGEHYIRLSAVLEKLRIAPAVDAVPVVRCRECVFFRERHVRTEDGQMKSYDEFPPEAFSRLGTGDVTSDYGINVGSQCLVDCNRGYGEDKTVFRQPDDYCSRGVRKMGAKMDGGAEG